MRSKTLWLTIVAIGCGLAAALLVSSLNRPATTVELLVARQAIKPGTRLAEPEGLFEPRQFLKGSEPPGAIADPNELRNKVLSRGLDAGQVCTKKDLTPPDFTASMPEGYRAMSVRATQDSALNGLVRPGSYVDVLCNVPEDHGKRLAQIFLQDKLVLAVNGVVDPPAEPRAPTVSTPATVTLAVTPDEFERLGWVSSQQTVILALRKEGDHSDVKTGGARGPFRSTSTKGEDRIEVYVARANLPAGTEIDDVDKHFSRLLFPRELVPANAVTRKEQIDSLENKRLVASLRKNQYCTLDSFDPREVPTLTIIQGRRQPEIVRFDDSKKRPSQPIPPKDKDARP